MLLYRARAISARPTRKTDPKASDPATRVRGRWFTSDLRAAIVHRDSLGEPAEILMLHLPDDVANSFRAATTPVTACGIEALRHCHSPLTDHVVPMFHAMAAEPVEIAGERRIRDYIDVSGVAAKPMRIVERPEEIRLAA